MRRPWRFLAVPFLLACEPTGVDDVETVQLTVRLKLEGDRAVGATPGRVWAFVDSAPITRAYAFPDFAEPCVLATTPVTVCTMQVPRFSYVSLIASEPDPAVFVRFAPQSPSDTVRDGRFVEFHSWTACPDPAERGVCVIRPRTDITIEGNFQLLQQVSVYQTGAAGMDYVTFPAGPTLRVPAGNDNILELAGCRRVFQYGPPCDSVRAVGDAPFHRFTAYVPRKTIVGMFPRAGTETEFARWDGDCILSGVYPTGTCSLISPDTSGAPILLTVRYTWWSCTAGPSERDTGGCARKEP